MIRLVISLCCITIFLLSSLSLNAQSYSHSLAYNETNTSSRSAATSIYRVRSENENYLEAFFSPDTIPTLSIPVLENALGNLVPDGVVNILDLLRLRDITIVRSPTPSPYELGKGDLNRDGKIDVQDLNILRDILLHKASVPYLVDSTGGEVLGDGITLVLPPGAVDTLVVISVKRYSENEFASAFGVDTKGAIQDSAYFMAGFDIISDKIDFTLPVNATIKLDSIPPCAYQGLNGLFAAVPDRDGDGKSELIILNELHVLGDSLKLETNDIPIPLIHSLSTTQIEPGNSLLISGSKFGKENGSLIVQFTSVVSDSSYVVYPSSMNDSSIVITAPAVQDGQYKITITDMRSGVVSNAQYIDVSPYTPLSGDLRSIILNYLMGEKLRIETINVDSLFAPIEDLSVRSYFQSEFVLMQASIDSDIAFYAELPDSLIIEYHDLASFLQNRLNHNDIPLMVGKRVTEFSEPCPQCTVYTNSRDYIKNLIQRRQIEYENAAMKCLDYMSRGWGCEYCDKAEGFRESALAYTDWLAVVGDLYLNCMCRCTDGGESCDKCPETSYIGFGPSSQFKGASGTISGGFSGGRFRVSGTCINIIRYKANECITAPTLVLRTSPVPLVQSPHLKCEEYSRKHFAVLENGMYLRPHPGSIIKITNAPVPYNIVGILNDNGNAFIPHVPLNTKVTFSMYDPVTGLYDPNVGTYTTGSTPGGFDRPILLFQPTTEIRRIAMRIGEIKHDSVSLDWQRIDYSLNVTAIDTGKMVNVGFEANALLSVRLEGPQGNVLLDSTNTDCYFHPRVRLNQVGTYTLRVSYGVSGQAGSFTVGVDYYPKPPIGTWFLCGCFIVDTLYEELSPYLIEDPLAIIPGDTVVVEHGVDLLFEHGGSVTSNGTLMGNGSSAKPIKLKHAGTAKRELATIKEPVSGRKEVKP